ncbi:MAG: NAD-dependent epimerase/dehydratase family protein, partial [Gammaproteobacteria bacterium]
VPFTIVRPHNLYGPRMGMAHVIPELLNRAYHADDGRLDVFSLEHSRTFCYITDGIEMIQRAAESHACTGETLNIGNQAPEIAIGQLADILLRVMSKELKVVPQPPTAGSPLRRCPDMAKTIKLTGYLPKIGLEEGIGLTYDWYKTHVFNNNGVTAK